MSNKSKILIVDDLDTNIDIVIDILKDRYDIFVALDGKSALNIVKENEINLILLDIMMPDMDGFEVCEILKLNDNFSKIPVIFLTSKDNNEDIEKGFDLGAVDYITKPFKSNELTSRVKNHLELKSYQAQLELKVQEEIDKNRLNEQVIFQKSKQAEIGELLMHIAHQWKQPLSELGSINIYNTAKLKQDGYLKEEELSSGFKKITNILRFMSDTVETFQNFYKPNNVKEKFHISESIYTAKNIINATFDYHQINLDIQLDDDFEIDGIQNEYSQIILSILNNAKSILIQRKIDKPSVSIFIGMKNSKPTINIEDNGGGVKIKNIDDIFLQFISKQQSSGMGLYMARSIMEKNGGTIVAKNINDGVKFTITL